jgi:hypothetical protein
LRAEDVKVTWASYTVFTLLHNLVTMLKPGQLKSPKEFSQQLVSCSAVSIALEYLMLRRSYASVLLKWRGNEVAAPAN